MVASNLVRGNFVRLIKFNLLHNNTDKLNIDIIHYSIYIRIRNV